MAHHQKTDEQVRALVRASEDLFREHGFDIVTDDQHLFPSLRPGLAARKDGRLIVCAVEVLPRVGQIVSPSEIDHIRNDVEAFIQENRPDRDPRIHQIEAAAIIQTPNDVRVGALPGDILWVAVQNPSELPAEFDRNVFSYGVLGIM